MPKETWELGLESSGTLFKVMGDLVDEDYAGRIGTVRPVWGEFESVALELQPEIEEKAMELYAKDESLALELLTLYSNALAVRSLETARGLIEKMGGATRAAAGKR